MWLMHICTHNNVDLRVNMCDTAHCRGCVLNGIIAMATCWILSVPSRVPHDNCKDDIYKT